MLEPEVLCGLTFHKGVLICGTKEFFVAEYFVFLASCMVYWSAGFCSQSFSSNFFFFGLIFKVLAKFLKISVFSCPVYLWELTYFWCVNQMTKDVMISYVDRLNFFFFFCYTCLLSSLIQSHIYKADFYHVSLPIYFILKAGFLQFQKLVASFIN